MPGNDEAGNPKAAGSLSLDDAERLASQFTPLWEEPGAAEAEAPAPAVNPPAPLATAPEPEATAPSAPESPGERPVASPAGNGPAPESPGERPVASPAGNGPALTETPPLVAIAAPMTSSPDIDPKSMELPDRRSDYAPPQPLAVPQRTMVGLAPPPPVLVAPSATTTPVGIAPAPLSRPALLVVPEPSAIALEPPEDRSSDPELDSIVPRKRKGIVFGVMGVAVALIAAVGVRMLFMKRDAGTATDHAPARAIPAATAPAPVATAPAVSVTAAPVEPQTSASAEPAGSAALAAPLASASNGSPMPSDENSALAAASVNAPTAGSALPTKAEPDVHPLPTKAVAETPKPHTPQRVEEPKRTPRAHVAPAHRSSATHPPVSPPLPGGGAIVRQSPF